MYTTGIQVVGPNAIFPCCKVCTREWRVENESGTEFKSMNSNLKM